jgi:hypothetical protein
VLLEARREVDDAKPAAGRLEDGLEDIGVVQIALRSGRPISGADQKGPAVRVQQSAEDRLGIEPGQATPDDGAGSLDERRALAVADEP